jgi:hypothetical protein
VKSLVVPAGVSVDVTLRNEDSVNHNFSVYTLDFASEFTGDMRAHSSSRDRRSLRHRDGSNRPSEPSVPPVFQPFDGTERLMCV